jgi:glycosyltransferase involved in cell wall biosynthesis
MASIGVDFHVFDGKFQGSRSHLLGVYAELVSICPQHQFFFFLEQTQALGQIPAFQCSNVTIVHMPHANPLVRLGWQLPRLRKEYGLDILHTQYVMPLWPAKGNAVTIHDVLFEPFPEFFTPRFVMRSRLMMRWAARHADMLFTVSDYSKQEISTRYGVAASQIDVVHNAVDTTHFCPGNKGSDFVTQRGLVSGEYLITVGRIEPRKNHANILRAYAQMPGKPPPLVIVGQRDFGYGDFETALAQMPATHKVLLLSNVGDEELPALCRHALAFIYPSLAEGFGMPPLEGLASGVPVITSATTAIPEVVGDAALLVDPTNVQELSDALQRVSANAELRASLVNKGLERAHHFTWKKSAQVQARSFQRFLDSVS